MQQLNPGIAKGYALDFASPLRFVAERLSERGHTLDELWSDYEHDPGDLARVWDHELRGRGQRRSAKPEVQAERAADARRWLLEAAIAALGSQVEQEADRFVLTVPLEDVRVGGLPVVMPATPQRDRPAAPSEGRPARTVPGRARRRAARVEEGAASAEPAQPEPEPEPEPPNPVRAWIERNASTEQRLAEVLDVPRRDVQAYLGGARPIPRVILFALWALDHGAEIDPSDDRGA